jgi:serine-type D-Ala-D-Ala endopeptidase (penicillin-binding protein 7)
MEDQSTFKQRVVNAAAWLGPCLGGVVLLVVGSLFSASSVQRHNLVLPPASSPRGVVVGGDAVPEQLPPSKPLVPLPKDATSFSGVLTADSVLVVDDRTDTVLYSKNPNKVRPLASISKLLTSLVLVDLPINWASTTVITKEDWDGSSHHLNVGEKFTLDDLFHVALIGSSNTAIEALARNSGLSSDIFVARLNEKAQQLGLSTVHVVEPTGLSDQNVGSATDVARLLKESLKNDRIAHILEQGEYYARPLGQKKLRRVWTTNWLLTKWIPSDFTADQVVGKTGFITSSLYNVAMRFENDNHRLIRVVVFGAATNEARFTESRDLADWIFDQYLWPDDADYATLSE